MEIRYCELCGKPILRRAYPGESQQAYEKRRFCSHTCANKGRKILPRKPREEKCHPGKNCFCCPYPDCRVTKLTTTPEENFMRECGDYVSPSKHKPTYYTAEVTINIDILCLKGIEEEKDFD